MNTNSTNNAAMASSTTPWSGVTTQVQNQLFPPQQQGIISTNNIIGPNLGQNHTMGHSSIIGQGQYGTMGSPIFTGSPTYSIGANVQSSYMFYKWNFGYDFPTHLFKTGEQLTSALFIENPCAMMFHISVWIEVCKPNADDYGVVWDGKISKYSTLVGGATASDNMAGVLLIKQGQTLDEFNTWWDEYTKRFKGDSWKTEQLPFIKEGQEISGCPIAHGEYLSYTGSQLMSTDKLFDRWCWIVEKTHQPVWFSNEFWVFNNTAEMLMYKLIDEK
jgi:hypothetical protein